MKTQCINELWNILKDFAIFAPIFDWTNIRFFSQLCIFQAAHFDIPEVLAVGRQENWQDWGYVSPVLTEHLHQKSDQSKTFIWIHLVNGHEAQDENLPTPSPSGPLATQAESAGASPPYF